MTVDTDWQQEWDELRDSVEGRMRGLPDEVDTLAHLWYFPSFDEWRSWTTRHNWQQPDLVRIQCVVWDQNADSLRLSPHTPLEKLKTKLARAKGIELEPTLSEDVQDVPRDIFSGILEEGLSIHVPVVVPMPSAVGTDGETCGFASGTAWANSSIEWWCDGPDVWRPFVEWWGRLRDAIDAVFEEKSRN